MPVEVSIKIPFDGYLVVYFNLILLFSAVTGVVPVTLLFKTNINPFGHVVWRKPMRRLFVATEVGRLVRTW